MSDVIRDEVVQALVAGEVFVFSRSIVGLAAADTDYSSFTTGSQAVMVDRRSYATSASNLLVRLWEGVSGNAGGTANPGVNRNRTPAALLIPQPATCLGGITPGALGTPVFSASFVDTNKVSGVFGDHEVDKIELAPNTTYVLGVTNNDAAAKDASWSFLMRRVSR